MKCAICETKLNGGQFVYEEKRPSGPDGGIQRWFYCFTHHPESSRLSKRQFQPEGKIPLTKDIEAIVVKQHSDGECLTEIAKSTGLTCGTARGIVRKKSPKNPVQCKPRVDIEEQHDNDLLDLMSKMSAPGFEAFDEHLESLWKMGEGVYINREARKIAHSVILKWSGKEDYINSYGEEDGELSKLENVIFERVRPLIEKLYEFQRKQPSEEPKANWPTIAAASRKH